MLLHIPAWVAMIWNIDKIWQMSVLLHRRNEVQRQLLDNLSWDTLQQSVPQAAPTGPKLDP